MRHNLHWVTVIIILLFAERGNAQALHWEHVGRPANVIALIASEESIYLGLSTHALASSDNGNSWKVIKEWLRPIYLNTMAAKGSSIFLGIHDGIWRSLDNGNTWTTANTGLANRIINTLEINSVATFAGTAKGLYRSTNNGDIWTMLDLDTNDHSVLQVNEKNILTTTYKNTYVLSTDNGSTWKKLREHSFPDDGIPWTSPDYMITKSLHGDDVFGGSTCGVFQYSWATETWKLIGLEDRILGQLYSNGNALIAIDEWDNIYRTTNKGASWDSLGKIGKGVVTMLSHKGKHFAALRSDLLRAGGGVLRYEGAETWAEMPAELCHFNVNGFAYCKNKLFVGTSTGIQVTSDNGKTWSFPKTPFDFKYVGGVASDGEVILVGADSLYRSSDEGSTWQAVYDFGGQFSMRGQEIIAVPGPIRSTDHGLTWQPTAPLKWLSSVAENATSIFAGRDCGGVYRSEDRGASWEQLPIHLGSVCIESLAALDTVIFAGTSGRHEHPRRGVYRSSDNGTTWKRCTNGLPPDAPSSYHTVTALEVHNGIVYTSIATYGVFRSTDGGISWESLGLEGSYISDIGFKDNVILAGGGGLYRAGQFGQSIEDSQVKVLHLHPNPSNSQLTINYAGKVEAYTALLDLLGRRVLETQSVANDGKHTIVFDVKTLTPGIYFVQITGPEIPDAIVEKALILGE